MATSGRPLPYPRSTPRSVLAASGRRQGCYKLLPGEVLWWFVGDGDHAPLADERLDVEDRGRVHERPLQVLGPEALEDRRHVPGHTQLLVDLRWFGPLS